MQFVELQSYELKRCWTYCPARTICGAVLFVVEVLTECPGAPAKTAEHAQAGLSTGLMRRRMPSFSHNSVYFAVKHPSRTVACGADGEGTACIAFRFGLNTKLVRRTLSS